MQPHVCRLWFCDMSTEQTPSVPRLGTVLVVSGPSGAGKSTVCGRFFALEPRVHFSVSCTTRAPRPGEQHGREYYFLSRAQFEQSIREHGFLEYAEVHGNFYGTPRSEVEPYLERGADVLLDIDVQGARQVRRAAGPDSTVARAASFAFIAPPSFAELERRLRGRGTESEETIRRRLANARGELEAWREYDYLVINDTVEAAAERLRGILLAGRCAVPRLGDFTF